MIRGLTVLVKTQSVVAVFIFMNSSVRGPFMHPMLAGRMHWTRVFTDAITDTVKLVGPSISCENFCFTPPGGEKTCRQHPHIQSVAVATDAVRSLLLEALYND